MAGARGVVTATVAGVERRLRFSLAALDAIETRLGVSVAEFFGGLADAEKIRFGPILTVFEELCRAGGTPLSDEDMAALLPCDVQDIIQAIVAAAQASGLEEVKGRGKSPSPSRPRGGGGKR